MEQKYTCQGDRRFFSSPFNSGYWLAETGLQERGGFYFIAGAALLKGGESKWASRAVTGVKSQWASHAFDLFHPILPWTTMSCVKSHQDQLRVNICLLGPLHKATDHQIQWLFLTIVVAIHWFWSFRVTFSFPLVIAHGFLLGSYPFPTLSACGLGGWLHHFQISLESWHWSQAHWDMLSLRLRDLLKDWQMTWGVQVGPSRAMAETFGKEACCFCCSYWKDRVGSRSRWRPSCPKKDRARRRIEPRSKKEKPRRSRF